MKLSPYRCARCDCRFLDTKIASTESPSPFVSRCIDRVRGWAQRTPYDTSTALALNAIIGSASVKPERRFVSIIAEPSQASAGGSQSGMQGDGALN